MFLVSATKLLLVCRASVAGYKGIQVDCDINEYDTDNMYPKRATFAGQHVAVNIYVDGNMLLVRATCCRGTYCPGVTRL